MRIEAVLLMVWLVIGAAAAGQRHYYKRTRELRQGGHHRPDDRCGPSQLLRREPEDLVQGTAAQSMTYRMPPALQ
jgi:hypothetical protein